ncbi:hypothetical protein HTVC142P_gp38 [Pelagibacter phage HTVC142P]|nr:hypothetical protein HTVC142P_gp38 [Pelagibacter phage HTVC142P]
MSNARDKANIPSLNFSSTGIDDNATSTAITIDSSENVDIVGTTTSSNFISDGTGYGITFPLNGTATLNTNSNSVIFTGSGSSGDYLAGTLNLQSRGNLDRDINLITGATASNTLTAHGNGDISFYEVTGTTPKFFWDTSLKSIGINTTTPETALHVALSGTNYGGVNTGTEPGHVLTISSAGNGGAGRGTSMLFKSPGNSSSVTTAKIDALQNSQSSTANNANLVFNVANTSGSLTRRLLIGNGGDISFYEDTGTTAKFYWDSSAESLGIGTTSPSNVLHIKNSNPTIRLEDSDASSSIYGQIISNGAGDINLSADVGNAGSSTKMTFSTDGSERMRINSSGNVGIGYSATLNGRLNVNGNVGLGNFISASNPTGGTYNLTDPDGSNINQIVRIGEDDDSGNAVADLQLVSYGSNDNFGGGNLRFVNSRYSNDVALIKGSRESATTGYLAFYTESSGLQERMRIDSSGNVGIGTNSPDASTYFGGKILHIADSSNAGIMFNRTSSTAAKWSVGCNSGGNLDFVKENSVKMRIDSSGNVLIKKTTSGFNTAGFEVKSGDEPIYVTTENNYNLLVNRKSSDGDLIRFYRSTSQKGSITVSGETVSYNAFTGSHWSRFTDNSKPTILRGTVLETLDEMLDWYNLEYNITTTTKDEDGNDVTNTETFGVPHVLTDSQSVGDVITYNHEGTDYQATIVKEADVKHMMSKVSDTTDAKNVYGVFNCYDEEQSEEGYNDFLVASVGSFLVRIKANETIAKGDLLQSNGDGTAKVQSDDNVKSSSFAKVLSTTIIETYEDGSYLVPCSLMC